MNYEQALAYIHKIDRFGMVLGLDTIRELLKRLGNPQDELKIIHVAGTNGKGSTSSFIASSLIESGYKIGLYTSPFLERFNERIKVGGIDIGDQDLADTVEIVRDKIETMVSDGLNHPTEFEVVTAVAFYYFKKVNVDLVVLEVGLGGRYDATNVIDKSLVPKSFLINYINLISKKCLILSQKNQISTQFTLRQKISNFLLIEEENGKVILDQTREELADFLSTTRPSLSRELSNMADEKIIKIRGREIYILKKEDLEELL